MAVNILAVGKKHEAWVVAGIERYEKRLRKPFVINWRLIPHSSLTGDRARQEESQRILSALKPSNRVYLLDERGEIFDSRELTKNLDADLGECDVTFIIGGAYGVNDEVRARANRVWSLSRLVFPHQLVRLILVEQIYRTQEIRAGGSYHHD